MPFAAINGIELYYESHGEGPAIVFLHGAAGNHMSWWQQLPAFTGRYRCITIDHRGFGRSRDESGESAARFVDDLAALLDELAIERTALVAQSMGGRTALGFTVLHPDRVSALVLADTSAGVVWPQLEQRMQALRAERDDPSLPLQVRALGARFQQRHPERAFLYRSLTELNPPDAADGARGASLHMRPTRDDLAALDVPTLFIVGSEDQLTAPEVMRELHGVTPGSALIEVPGCGHSVYFEAPEVFNAAVLDFIAGHP